VAVVPKEKFEINLNYIYAFISRRTVNTLRLGYKHKTVNTV